MGPNYAKLQRVVELVISLTRKGRLDWTRMRKSRTRDGYTASMPDATVQVYSKDSDGRQPFILEIYDGVGELSVQASSHELGGELFEMIADLYEAAHESATNVDPLLDSLINILQREDDSQG
ncbi:hypothetical protein [Streptomyces sp. GESEQ-4]|uniref:hypothetical protein n=1 Tax=Streptomyces sp. GESEQ-4 TaxID=2812655 RepID=UPI001B3245A5|nr:hypothetical protein [Streptomyces sp. GESEQ-4]